MPKKDTMTEAINTSGATTACSSTPRITAITTSDTGMTTLRSLAVPLLKSYWVALPPPIKARTPGAGWATRARSFGTRLNARDV